MLLPSVRYASFMKRDEWTDDEIIHWLMEIDRKLKLLAIMITIFAMCWAFASLFPIVASTLS